MHLPFFESSHTFEEVAASFVLGIRHSQHIDFRQRMLEDCFEVTRKVRKSVVATFEAVYETQEQRLLHPGSPGRSARRGARAVVVDVGAAMISGPALTETGTSCRQSGSASTASPNAVPHGAHDDIYAHEHGLLAVVLAVPNLHSRHTSLFHSRHQPPNGSVKFPVREYYISIAYCRSQASSVILICSIKRGRLQVLRPIP